MTTTTGRAARAGKSKHAPGRPLSIGSAPGVPFGPLRLSPEQARALRDWATARGLRASGRPSAAEAVRDLAALAAGVLAVRSGSTRPDAWWRRSIAADPAESVSGAIALDAGLGQVGTALVARRGR